MLIQLALLMLSAHATDRHVELGGNDAANDCSSSASPCATLDHALTEASSGDTVYLGAGSFGNTAAFYPMQVPDGVNIEGVSAAATTVETGAGTLLFLDGPMEENISNVRLSNPSGNVVQVFANSSGNVVSLQNVTVDAANRGIEVFQSGGHAEIDLDTVEINAFDAVTNFGGGSVALLATNTTIAAGGTAVNGSSSSVYSAQYEFEGGSINPMFGAGAVAQFGGAGFNKLALRNLSVTTPSGISGTVYSSAGTALVVLDGVTMTDVTSNAAVAMSDLGGLVGLVVRDSDIASPSGLRMYSNTGQGRMLIDNSTITGGARGLDINPSSSAIIDLDVRGSELVGQSREAVLIQNSVGASTIMEMRDTVVRDGGNRGVVLRHDFGTQSEYTLDGVTISGMGGIAVDATMSSSSGTMRLDVLRSDISGNGVGVQTYAFSSSVTPTIRLYKNRIVDNAGDGVSLRQLSGVSGEYLLRHNLLHNNGMQYTNPNAYDLEGVNSSASSGYSADALENWWGTVDNTVIDSHVFDVADSSAGFTFDRSAMDSTLGFAVQPPYGVPEGGEIRIERRDGFPALVERTGALEMTVTIGGQPAEVLWGAPDGSAVRVRRPAMAPGTYDVVVTDPHGHTGTEVGSYTVDSTLPAPIVLGNQAWVTGRGTWVRLVGPPFGVGRLYLSGAAEGPRACPPELGGDCLQIPGPLEVARRVDLGPTGIRWIRIGPANLPAHPTYVSSQVYIEDTMIPGSYVSEPETYKWLANNGDADLDGFKDFSEHRASSNAYKIDSDGDGCYDAVDSDPLRSSVVGDNGYPNDCDPW